MRTTLPLFFLAAITGAACGGGGDDGGSTDPDAEEGGGDCLAAASYTAFNTPVAFSEMADGATTPDFIQLEADLDAAATPDVVLLQLYKGFGAFSTGEIVPGTYQITGDEAQFATCGVCVLILTDVDSGTGMGTGTPYLATAGTVTITSVSPNLTGSVSNLEMTHVDIDAEDMSTPSADGCSSSISAASFDAVVTAQ